MQEVFDKIIDKLEEKIVITWKHDYDGGRKDAFNEAIEIVKQEAEQYNNGWIPCSSGNLPDDLEDILIDMGGTKPIPAYIHNREWYLTDCRGSSEKVKDQTRVEAWHPLPEQYRPCTNTDCVYNSGNECPASE